MPLVWEIAGRLLRLPAPVTRELLVERDLPLAMDDSVVPYADRYAPRGRSACPVLVRLPHGRLWRTCAIVRRLVLADEFLPVYDVSDESRRSFTPRPRRYGRR